MNLLTQTIRGLRTNATAYIIKTDLGLTSETITQRGHWFDKIVERWRESPANTILTIVNTGSKE